MSKNDITGDNIVSKGLSKQGRENFDSIFGVKKRETMDSAAGSRLPASETANRDGEISQPAGLPETVQD